jgi:hypothetical protein
MILPDCLIIIGFQPVHRFLNAFQGCCQEVIDRHLRLLSIRGIRYEDYACWETPLVILSKKGETHEKIMAHVAFYNSALLRSSICAD